MKRIDFYKRLYYMLILISLNIVLLEAQSCTYDPNINDCVPDYSFFFSTCEVVRLETYCLYKVKFCKEIEPAYANETNCPKLDVEDLNNKCIYDSENNKCKEEALSCLSVKYFKEKSCKNAPTSDDTKKICIYDETTNTCQEVDKPDGGEKNDSPKKRKKSGDWKTVKIIKEFKALKRYRIVKRLNKLIGLKN